MMQQWEVAAVSGIGLLLVAVSLFCLLRRWRTHRKIAMAARRRELEDALLAQAAARSDMAHAVVPPPPQ